MEDVLKTVYFELHLGYDIVDWFVDEVFKVEKKIVFYFKNTNKEIILTEEDDEHYREANICRFCEQQTLSEKIQ